MIKIWPLCHFIRNKFSKGGKNYGMINLLILSGVILIMCVATSKLLYKVGIPILLIFILFGMLFGSDGIGGIYFDNYELAKEICSFGLIFIMFYGGFSTNWKMAKPVATQAILMSTVGVVATAGLTGLFCHFILGMNILESFLIGSVVSSTDAASVFNILRAQKLNLKGGLASLLEIESGSNDPFAYMLTLTIITFMKNNSDINIALFLIMQVILGIAIGIILSKLMVLFLRHMNFEIEGFYPICITAAALLSYSLSEFIGGNGYLSVYVAGIILGNSRIPHKKSLVQYLDGISWLMQIMLFFILGLLSFPSKLPEVMLYGISISIFMIIIARPIATFVIMKFFNASLKEILFISWVGLRGAASIVFAIFAVTQKITFENDIYHIIFLIALISVSLQGTLIPFVAKKLDLVDNNESVLRTFNDYKEEKSTQLIEMTIPKGDRLEGKSIMDANIPDEILIVMIKRKGEVLVPKGSTVIEEGDILVLSGNNIKEVLKKREEENKKMKLNRV